MEELAAAAADADGGAGGSPEGVASAEQTSCATSAKKPTRSKVDIGKRNVAEAQAAIDIAQAKIDGVAAKGALATQAERKQAARALAKLPELQQKLAAANNDLVKRVEKAAAVEAAAAAKAAAAAERDEVARHMSDAGVLVLVESRLKLQHRIDNSSDTSDAVWSRVHYMMESAIQRGDLPTGDGRSAKALEKRYSTEWGEFRLWCARAQRAVSYSGVPADEVEEKVKEHYRISTALFLKYNMGMRPMAQPAFQMSGAGGLAATGLGQPVGAAVAGAAAGAAAAGEPAAACDTARATAAQDTVHAGNMGGGGDDDDDDDFDFELQSPPPAHPSHPSASASAASTSTASASATPSATPPTAATAATADGAPPSRAAPSSGAHTTTPSSNAPPLHIGGENPACMSVGSKRSAALAMVVAQEAQKSRDFLKDMFEAEEKRRQMERAHELEMAKTVMQGGGCAQQ